MYKRMLDKTKIPTEFEIENYLGYNAFKLFINFEEFLMKNYTLKKELKFPFGNHYGWGYKYCHKSKHLCYLFFEDKAFTITMQLGDDKVKEVTDLLNKCLPKTQKLWENRYPCGE